MRYVPVELNGSPMPLRLTAGALFDIYDRWGVHDSILRASGALEDTEDGLRACRDLAVILAEQEELWRRRQGYGHTPVPTAWQLQTADSTALRSAVRVAVARGFARAVPTAEDTGEVNLILSGRDDEAAESADRIRVSYLAVCAARLHLAPADALLLTPGEYLDMVALLTGAGEEGDHGNPDNYN